MLSIYTPFKYQKTSGFSECKTETLTRNGLTHYNPVLLIFTHWKADLAIAKLSRFRLSLFSILPGWK